MPNGDLEHSRRSVSNIALVDWLYLAVAIKELALARIRFARRPAGEILADLKSRNANADAASAEEVPQRVKRLGWAIGAAAERLPWRADCLLRVMAADRWLRRIGHAPRFELGVAKAGNEGLRAHVWLHVEGYTVTGGDAAGYTMLISESGASSA